MSQGEELPIPVGTRVKVSTWPRHFAHRRTGKVYDGPFIAVEFQRGDIYYASLDELTVVDKDPE